MEKVDLVLVGAEGVVESGGIINKVISSEFTITFCKLWTQKIWRSQGFLKNPCSIGALSSMSVFLLLKILQYYVLLAPSLHVFYMSPQIGTNQIAVCAKAQNKPFYVVAESFKFVRLFPLNQRDVPDKFKVRGMLFFFRSRLRSTHVSMSNFLLSTSSFIWMSTLAYLT